MKIEKPINKQVKWTLICLNYKGEPSSKAKYDILAIVNSTERE